MSQSVRGAINDLTMYGNLHEFKLRCFIWNIIYVVLYVCLNTAEYVVGTKTFHRQFQRPKF